MTSFEPDATDVSDQGKDASTLELFFDLVFVFSFTQVTSYLVDHQTWGGLARGAAILAAVWWAWMVYSWLTQDASAEENASERLILFGAMASMLIVALAIPNAFSGTALIFGVAYFVVRLLHVLLDTRVAPAERRAALHRLAPGLVGGPALLVVAGFVGGPLANVLWIVALAIDYGIVFIRNVQGFHVDVGHFVERHQLIMIVALGESIVAIGVAVGTEGLTSGPVVVLAVLLGFILIVTLWWLYFDYKILAAGQKLATVSGHEQTLLARNSYSGLHLPIVGSIIFIAMGIEQTLAHVNEPLGVIAAIGLCGGSALYLLGHNAWRYHEHGSVSVARLVVAVVALGLIFVAVQVIAIVVLAVLTALLVGLAAYETVFSEYRNTIRGRHLSQSD
jgi:low temperature requirement protein LtrA